MFEYLFKFKILRLINAFLFFYTYAIVLIILAESVGSAYGGLTYVISLETTTGTLFATASAVTILNVSVKLTCKHMSIDFTSSIKDS